MGWWWFGKKTDGAVALTAEERKKLNRKCRALNLALTNCRKANTSEVAACRNLENSLVTCYAAEYCKPEFEEHKRCYTSVSSTGRYEGGLNCDASIKAMQDGLRRYGLYPLQKS
jgi:hypothetical protein